MTQNRLLEVKGLKKYYRTSRGMLHAVDGVSFAIDRGKTLGLVGESGCGKSTVARTILRLIEPTDGEIMFNGENLRTLKKSALRKKRQDMQLIFQDPSSSINPRKTVGQTIAQPIHLHALASGKRECEEKVLEIMRTVGLTPRLLNAYPHELDGGRRQRVGIARALAVNPKFIVCDEPVSALDVSIRAQILNLMKELQEQREITYLFITHDLSVVKHFSDDIAVMYLGKLVERAPADELFANPVHPYTQALLSAVPIPDPDNHRERIALKGEIPSPIDPVDACRFANRCIYAFEHCRQAEPQLKLVNTDHTVACFLAEDKARGSAGRP